MHPNVTKSNEESGLSLHSKINMYRKMEVCFTTGCLPFFLNGWTGYFTIHEYFLVLQVPGVTQSVHSFLISICVLLVKVSVSNSFQSFHDI